MIDWQKKEFIGFCSVTFFQYKLVEPTILSHLVSLFDYVKSGETSNTKPLGQFSYLLFYPSLRTVSLLVRYSFTS
jgi:hypothetical protein